MSRHLSVDQLVKDTPAERDRVIDLMRVIALVCVVIGHWLMQGVYVDDDGPHRDGMLGLAPWTHPLTWLLQVMPIIFLVGGFSNALSWRRARDGTTYGAWLYWRTRRLTRPLLPLLVFWSAVASLAGLVGVNRDWLRIASKASLAPTWFLAVYLLVVALVPITLWVWDRIGLASIVAGLLLAGIVDIVSLAADNWLVGVLNILLVWGTMHQVGYAWLDGAMGGQAFRWWLALGSFAALVALVWLGPYGVSMVGVDGFGVDNTDPPRVTLLLLGLWQVGVALVLERRLRAVTARRRVWVVTAAVESRMMTIYLWHLTALGLLLGLAMWTGSGLHAVPDTAGWWLALPLWLAVLAVTTGLITWSIGRYELPPGSRPDVPVVVSLAEALAMSAAIAALAHYGLVLPGGHVLWYLPLAAGLLLVGVARTSDRRWR